MSRATNLTDFDTAEYFSNHEPSQWNRGRFIAYLYGLPSFPRDAQIRKQLVSELWLQQLQQLKQSSDLSRRERANRLFKVRGYLIIEISRAVHFSPPSSTQKHKYKRTNWLPHRSFLLDDSLISDHTACGDHRPRHRGYYTRPRLHIHRLAPYLPAVKIYSYANFQPYCAACLPQNEHDSPCLSSCIVLSVFFFFFCFAVFNHPASW